jgi:hypothetical protein
MRVELREFWCIRVRYSSLNTESTTYYLVQALGFGARTMTWEFHKRCVSIVIIQDRAQEVGHQGVQYYNETAMYGVLAKQLHTVFT